MILGIHHIAIGVPDFDKGLEFYTQVLGFELVETASFSGSNPPVEAAIGLTQPEARMAMLKGGNAYIELWQYQSPVPKDLRASPNDYGYPHFALEVQNIDDEYERLREAGMSFVGPPVDFGQSSAVYGADPFGNVIEIYEIRDANRAQLANTPLVMSAKTDPQEH